MEESPSARRRGRGVRGGGLSSARLGWALTAGVWERPCLHLGGSGPCSGTPSGPLFKATVTPLLLAPAFSPSETAHMWADLAHGGPHLLTVFSRVGIIKLSTDS